jgi:hypothetical protein
MISKRESEIERNLREGHYQTKTRGEQRLPAARPAGEGVYVISITDGRMHLSYALELPAKPGEVQRAFKIAPEGSFVLSVKNPELGQPKGVGLSEDRKADYPDKLQAVFHGRRFAQEDTRLLDYEGAEIMLVGAHRDPERVYGIRLDTESGNKAHADALRKLRMAPSRHPVKPLFQGKWD